MQIREGKMIVLCAVVLILRTVVADTSVDCLPSIENIMCVCSNTSLSCNGTQDYHLDVVELIVNISDNLFDGNISSVDISVENLTLSKNSSFKNVTIYSLKLNSGLSYVDDTFFSALRFFLRVLNLSFNNFVEVPSGALTVLDNLHTLDLSYNNIKAISKNDFISLTNLRILNLKHNAITIVESGAFSNLTSLEVLHLAYNDIFLNDTFFEDLHGLNNLKYLSISGNNFSSLSSESITMLPLLKTLYADENSIMDLANIQINSSSLQKLSVHHCAIQGPLKTDSLKSLPSLVSADLSYNNVTEVQSRALSALMQLNDINLSYNKIKTLGGNAFSALFNLIELDLQHNDIQVVALTAFHNLTKLRYLNLNNNKLKAFLCPYTAHLLSLETIHLENNQIKLIKSGAFIYSQNLTELKLTDMEESTQNPTPPHPTLPTSLHCCYHSMLKVRNVRAQCVPSGDVLNYSALDPVLFITLQREILPFVVHMLIQELSFLQYGNELNCTCSLYDFSMYLHNRTVRWNEDTSAIKCSSPPSLLDKSVSEVDYSGLKCFSSHPCEIPLPYDSDDDDDEESSVIPLISSTESSSLYNNTVDVVSLSSNTSDAAVTENFENITIDVSGLTNISNNETSLSGSAVTENFENITIDVSGLTNISNNETSLSGSADLAADNVSVVDAINSTGLELTSEISETSIPAVFGVINDAGNISHDDATNSTALNSTPSKISEFTRTGSPVAISLTDSLTTEHIPSILSSSSSFVVEIASTASILISDANDTSAKGSNFTEAATTDYNASSSSSFEVIHFPSAFPPSPTNFTSISTNVPISLTNDSTTSEPTANPFSLSTVYNALIDIKNYSLINKKLCVDYSVDGSILNDTKYCLLTYTYEKNKPAVTKHICSPSSSDKDVKPCLNFRHDTVIKLCITLKSVSSKIVASVCVPGPDFVTPPEQPPTSTDAYSLKNHITESFSDLMTSSNASISTATEIILSTHSTFSPGLGNSTSPRTNVTLSPIHDSTISEPTKNLFILTTMHGALIDIKNYSLMHQQLCIDWSIDRAIQNDTKSCYLTYTYEKNKYPIQQQLKCPSNNGSSFQCLTEKRVKMIDKLCIKLSNSLGKFFYNVCTHEHDIDAAPEQPSTSTATSYLMTSNSTDSVNVSQTTVFVESQTAFNLTDFSILAEGNSITIKWSVNRQESYAACILKLNIEFSSTVKEEDFNCTDNSHVINQIEDGVTYKICLTSNHSIYGRVMVCSSYDNMETRVVVAAIQSSPDHSIIILICLFALAICFLAVIAARAILKRRHAADAYNVTKEESNISLRKQSAHGTINQGHSSRYSYTASEAI